MAERKTFVEFQDFLVLARALAGLGCGVGAVQVGGGELAGCTSFGLGIGKSAFQVSSRDLGRKFFGGGTRAGVPALFWPGLDGLDLWVWVGLCFNREGVMGFGRVFLLSRWSDVGTSFWDTRYFHTL